MKSELRKPCLGELLLVSSIGLGAYFSYWMIADSADEKVHRIFIEHDQTGIGG